MTAVITYRLEQQLADSNTEYPWTLAESGETAEEVLSYLAATRAYDDDIRNNYRAVQVETSTRYEIHSKNIRQDNWSTIFSVLNMVERDHVWHTGQFATANNDEYEYRRAEVIIEVRVIL